MKAVIRRLRRLEEAFMPQVDLAAQRLSDLLRERRRRRLEASGEPFDELDWASLGLPPGTRLSESETLRLARPLIREGVTSVRIFESGKPDRDEAPTPEEKERCGPSWRTVAQDVPGQPRSIKRGAFDPHISSRLGRLEERAKEVAAARPKPHTLCFISVDQKVVSTFEMATGKWTAFNPPREPAKFEPMM